MSNFKQTVLRKLASDLGEGSEEFFDALDRPGRATRAAISAIQEDKPVFEAIKRQFGANPPEAPSGADIAERFGEDYDIQNPAVLGSIATAADFVDPTMLIPGGQVGRLGAQVGKLGAVAKKLPGPFARGVGKGVKVVDDMPQGSYGSVKVVDDAPTKIGSVKVVDDAPKGGGQVAGSDLKRSVSLPEYKKGMQRAGVNRQGKMDERLGIDREAILKELERLAKDS
jgi:hypothetical protein